MDSHSNKETARLHLKEKLKELHTHSYLTLLSIGQGVSLTILAESLYEHREQLFTSSIYNLPLTPWLLTIITFIFLILVWNDFFMVVTVFTWTPTLIDATINFCLFATEIAMSRTIMESDYWFKSNVLFGFCSIIAFVNTYFRSKKRPENTVLFQLSEKRMRVSILMISIMVAVQVSIIIAASYNPKLYIIGIAVVIMITLLFITTAIKTWREVIMFMEGKTTRRNKDNRTR